jgi:hypothetical protein
MISLVFAFRHGIARVQVVRKFRRLLTFITTYLSRVHPGIFSVFASVFINKTPTANGCFYQIFIPTLKNSKGCAALILS